MLRRKIRILFALAAPALALAACDNSGTPLALTGARLTSSHLSVRLTDAPGDLAEAWVKVKNVQLVADSLAPDTTVKDTSQTTQLAPDSGWVNLLALTGGKTKDLFSGAVRAGRYSQVRLIVCDMYIRTTDGQIIATPGTTLPAGVTATPGSELKLTSQCQSGFKVVLKGDSLRLGADSSSALVIDFDAGRSFAHEAGKSGKWIVTPVLFGTVSGGSGAGSGAGSIAGNVVVDSTLRFVKCGGDSLTADSLRMKFVPTAKADTAVHTGTTTAAGAYTIGNLAPATYTLGFEKLGFANGDSLTYTATATPATVTVTAGNAARADYGVSAVSCKPHA